MDRGSGGFEQQTRRAGNSIDATLGYGTHEKW
jgi:hypothetical protein